MALGIRSRFSLFILGSVVLIFTLTMVSTLLVIRRFAIDDARDFSLTILQETNTKVTTFVTDIEHLARSLAEYRVVREVDTDEFRDLFVSQVMPRKRYIRAIYMGTTTGEMYEYGQGPGFTDHAPQLPDDYDPRTRPWYQAALEADDFTMSDPYLYASYPLLGITGAIPVHAVGTDPAAGDIVGVIGVDILLDDLRNVMVDLQIPKNGRALLLDDSSRIIAGDEVDSNHSSLTLPEFDRNLFARISAPETGSFLSPYQGELTFLSHTVNPATGWYLVLALPYESILRPVNSVLRFMAVLDAFLVGVLLVMIRYLSGRLVLRPIEEIVNTVNRLHAGERNARVQLSRDDEIGVLAREFNDLVSTVESNTTEMEQQVSQRTREVQELERENSRLRLIKERERIYRDLHDSLGAQLTNISICASVAQNSVESDVPRLTEMIGLIEGNAQSAIESLRETILGEPDFTSLATVIDRVEQMAQRRLSLRDIALVFSHMSEAEEDTAPEIAETIYRISEELIANIQKHAAATRVELTITTGDGVVLSCSDNGTGFDPSGGHRGFGLENIRRRLAAVGGGMELTSSTAGTTVICTIPGGYG